MYKAAVRPRDAEAAQAQGLGWPIGSFGNHLVRRHRIILEISCECIIHGRSVALAYHCIHSLREVAAMVEF